MNRVVGAVLLTPARRAELFTHSEADRLAGSLVEVPAERLEDLIDSPVASDVEVLVTGWGTQRLNSDLLARLPALRAVVHAAGTVRGLIDDGFWSRGIALSSAADVNAEPVADFLHAAVVLALKGLPGRSRLMRARPAEMTDLPAVHGIYDARVGLVSYGATARSLAGRLRTLASHVSSWDPYVPDGQMRADGVTPVPRMEDLFKENMVVSIHTPWIPGVTDGIIGARHIQAMPTGATLINTARGAIVRQDELVAVARARPDLTFVLDVTIPEPPEANSALYSLENVVLTGHVAGSVGTEIRRMGTFVADQLERLAEGGPLQGELTRQSSALRA